MTTPRHGYFSDVSRRLHLEAGQQAEILNELEAHVEDKARELAKEGVPIEEAIGYALNQLGAARKVAGQLYAVHSKDSWHHTALAVLPHIMLSLTFALHLWTKPGWVVLMLAVALSIGIVGWKLGRPRWTYPWLGYCLLAPIVSWGLAMSAVGYGAWGVLTRGTLPLSIPIYIASFIYITFSLWMVIRVVSKVARPDWIMASLTVLPLPFLGYWFFYFLTSRQELQAAAAPIQQVDGSAAIVFLVLALATAIFFRVGRRLLRVALLLITAPSMIVLAWFSYQGGPGYVAVFVFAATSLGILLSPALFDLKDRFADEAPIPMKQTQGSRSS